MRGHAAALTDTGTGAGAASNAGVGTPAGGRRRRVLPSLPAHTLALFAAGLLFVIPAVPRAASERHVTVGAAHVCSVQENASIACWGNGDHSNATTAAPGGAFHGVTAGDNYTCGLAVNGSMVCWGTLPGCTDGSPGGTFTPADDSGAPIEFADIHGGARHVCGMQYNGSVHCYGDGSRGATSVPPGVVFQGVTAGAQYTCGVARNHSVACWGDAANPVVADAAYVGAIRDAEHVACGGVHACYVRVNGSVACWGASNGTAPPPAVAFGADTWWLAGGVNATCAISGAATPGAVRCWGDATTAPVFDCAPALEVACGAPGCVSLGVSDLAGAGTSRYVATRSTWPASPPAPSMPRAPVYVLTVAGRAAAGWADGAGTAAQFHNPEGVAVNAGGVMYVADAYTYRIRVVTPGGVVSTLAGSGTVGYANGTGTAAQFYDPGGIALDSTTGVAYVADGHRIRVVTRAGVVTTLAGSTTGGWADGVGTAAQFSSPSGVAVGATRAVFVADFGNNRIRVVTPAGAATTLAGSGVAGWADGTGTAAKFDRPFGVAVDGAGVVYVADQNNNRVRVVTPGGVVTTLAGSGAYGWVDGGGTAAQFKSPTGVAVDCAGTVYVVDCYGHRIRAITPAGIVTTLAGSGVASWADGAGTAAHFNTPYSVAVASAGLVYVADRANFRIRAVVFSFPAALAIVTRGVVGAADAILPWRATLGNSTTPGTLDAQGAVFVGPLRGVNTAGMNPAVTSLLLGTVQLAPCSSAAGSANATFSTSAQKSLLDLRLRVPSIPGNALRAAALSSLTVSAPTGALQLADRSFAGLPALECINDGNCSGVANLTRLGVFSDAPGMLRLEALSGFATAPRITTVDLRSNGIAQVPVAAPGGSWTAPAVRALLLCSGNNGAASHMLQQPGALAPFPHVRSLIPAPVDSRALIMRSCDIRALHPTALLGVDLANVTAVDLSGNAIVSAADVVPALLPFLSPITAGMSLDLSGNSITSVGAHDFDGAYGMAALSLANNPIAFIAETAFTSVKHPTLTTINETGVPLRTAPCAPGCYNDARAIFSGARTVVCVACPIGAYCPGTSTLTLCAAGTYGTGASAATAAACAPCPAGTFNDQPGQPRSGCLPCPVGTASRLPAANASSACEACAAGTYAGSQGSARCMACGPGTYGLSPGADSAALCTPCRLNTFSSAVGGNTSAVCTPCPAGSNTLSEGATSGAACATIACPTGYARNGDGACSPCSAGTYSQGGVCAPCPAGRYAAEPGVGVCTQCPAGTFGSATGGTSPSSCAPCPAGTFNDQPGQPRSGCLPCPVGTASRLPAANTSSACEACAAGTYAGSQGSARCTVCGPGTYGATQGADSAALCTPCDRDTYSGAVGATTSAVCIPCPPSSNTLSEGATSDAACVIKACPTGYARNETGACSPCDVGTYSQGGVCTPCPAGRYAAAPGLSTCAQCPAGTYRGATGGNSSSSCAPCPAGTVCLPSGTACTAICPAGTLLTALPSSPSLQRILSRCGTVSADDAAALCTPCTTTSSAGTAACVPGMMSPVALLSALLPSVSAASAGAPDAAAAAQLEVVRMTSGDDHSFASCGGYATDTFLTRPVARFAAIRTPLLAATLVSSISIFAVLLRYSHTAKAGASLRAALVRLDQFSSAHSVPAGEALRNAPTAAGGVFTAVCVVAALGLSLSVLVQLGTAAYTLTQSVVVTPSQKAGSAMAGVHIGPLAARLLLIGDTTPAACAAVRLVPPPEPDSRHAWSAVAATTRSLEDASLIAAYGLPPAIVDGVGSACEVTVACAACALASGAFGLTVAAPPTFQSVVIMLTTRAAYPGCTPAFVQAFSAPSASALLERVTLDISVNPVFFTYTGRAATDTLRDGTGHDLQLAAATTTLKADATLLHPDVDVLAVELSFVPTPYTTLIAVADALEPLTVVFSVLGMVSALVGGFRMLVRRHDSLLRLRQASRRSLDGGASGGRAGCCGRCSRGKVLTSEPAADWNAADGARATAAVPGRKAKAPTHWIAPAGATLAAAAAAAAGGGGGGGRLGRAGSVVFARINPLSAGGSAAPPPAPEFPVAPLRTAFAAPASDRTKFIPTRTMPPMTPAVAVALSPITGR